MLAVHFYSIKSNEYLGEGFYISDFEIFENYELNNLQAKKIKDNKYELPDGKRYICLENWKSRRGVR